MSTPPNIFDYAAIGVLAFEVGNEKYIYIGSVPGYTKYKCSLNQDLGHAFNKIAVLSPKSS
jgi:hypothetical protein